METVPHQTRLRLRRNLELPLSACDQETRRSSKQDHMQYQALVLERQLPYRRWYRSISFPNGTRPSIRSYNKIFRLGRVLEKEIVMCVRANVRVIVRACLTFGA